MTVALRDKRSNELSEADEQKAVIDYCYVLGIPVYHVPNEGKRSGRQGNHLKRQGLKPGVPDLCFPFSRGGYHGLYIEMKRPIEKGKSKPTVSAFQREWIELLADNGYMACVCFGFDEAKKVIDGYARLK